MDVARAAEDGFERGDEARFTGEVWLRSAMTAPDGTSVSVVHFAPGARTHWHRHPGGQFLYGVSGRGRVRTRGQRGHQLDPGDVVHAGSEEWHWHGGGPESPMIHVAVSGGGAPEWGDPVGDEDYSETF
jgi:quercetin dioxygenase-like cupin family protein